jgi:hypothetical protein
MSAGVAVAGLSGGLLVAGGGVLLIYRALRFGTKYRGDPEPSSKIMCRVAGAGIFLAGTGMMIQSLRKLLR